MATKKRAAGKNARLNACDFYDVFFMGSAYTPGTPEKRCYLKKKPITGQAVIVHGKTWLIKSINSLTPRHLAVMAAQLPDPSEYSGSVGGVYG